MVRIFSVLFWFLLTLVSLVWGYRLIYLAGPWGFEIGQQDLVARVHWLFVLLGAAMPYLMGLAFVFALVFAVFRAWRWFGLLLVLIGLEAGMSLSRTQFTTSSNASPTGQISVASFNMQANREALAAFAALSQEADVIHLSEVPQAYKTIDFEALFPGHTLHQSFYYPGYRGSMIALVRGESQVNVDAGPGGDWRPIFDIRLARGSQSLRVLASHPLAPFFPSMMTERNHTLNRFHALVDEEPNMPTILMGDMNTTPFEVDGWRLPGKLVGNPFQASWSGLENIGRWKEVARLRIDHIRMLQTSDKALRPLRQSVGPDLNSDHLPVFATFAIVK